MSVHKESLTSLGEEIVNSLSEFADALRSGKAVEKQFTVRTVELDLVPQTYDSMAVKSLRDRLNLSQPLFARYLGISVKTLRSWEQGMKEPSPMACRFMDEIAAHPERVHDRLYSTTDRSK